MIGLPLDDQILTITKRDEVCKMNFDEILDGQATWQKEKVSGLRIANTRYSVSVMHQRLILLYYQNEIN